MSLLTSDSCLTYSRIYVCLLVAVLTKCLPGISIFAGFTGPAPSGEIWRLVVASIFPIPPFNVLLWLIFMWLMTSPPSENSDASRTLWYSVCYSSTSRHSSIQGCDHVWNAPPEVWPSNRVTECSLGTCHYQCKPDPICMGHIWAGTSCTRPVGGTLNLESDICDRDGNRKYYTSLCGCIRARKRETDGYILGRCSIGRSQSQTFPYRRRSSIRNHIFHSLNRPLTLRTCLLRQSS